MDTNYYNNNPLKNNLKIQYHKYSPTPKFNFYQNQTKNNYTNILPKNNNNIESIKRKIPSDLLGSNITSNIYEKNIEMLNEKIKEQENDIIYLNSRLKNYDTSMEEITKLNIELNKLNEIIREKEYTIQEYREITELSKKKFDELIKNKNGLIQRIKKLEKENKELKNNINYFDNNVNGMKKDLNELFQENRELKRQLYEKNKKLKDMNDLLERLNTSPNNKALDVQYNTEKIKNFNNQENNYINNYRAERNRTPLIRNLRTEENDLPNERIYNYKQEYQLRTEPNNDIFNDIKTSYRY